MGLFADYKIIDSIINSIVNRNAPGVFAEVGDSSTSSDKRYSDDLITWARRQAGYRIIEAIASNIAHPLWAELKSDVTVNHGSPIPVHFGEIGIPLIAPSQIDRIISSVTKEDDDNVTISASALSNWEKFTADDPGLTCAIFNYSSGIAVVAATISAFDSSSVVTLSNYTLGGSGTKVNAGHYMVIYGPTYMTGQEASSDEIDAWRNDSLGMFSAALGEEWVDSGCRGTLHPRALRYSTDNGVFKFTGYDGKIPMIPKSSTYVADRLVKTGFGQVTLGGSVIAVTGFTFDVSDVGRRIVVAGNILSPAVDAEITSYIDPDEVSIFPRVAIDNSTGGNDVCNVYDYGATSADVFVDDHIPADMIGLNVKLALPMIVKEGDSIWRLAVAYSQEAEAELMRVRSGAVAAAPVNTARAVQMAQQLMR